MRRALTPVNSSVGGCSAGGAVVEAGGGWRPAVVGVRWRTTALRFADGVGLLGSSEEELRQLTRRLEGSAPKRAKLSSTASSQDHLPTDG